MKKLLVFVATLACSVLLAQNASAHVLVMDDTKTHGAVLHIIPDDDPVAGEKASLYFDMQDELARAAKSISLTVRNDVQEQDTVAVKKEGSLVTADYMFPSQGVYEIKYTVETNRGSYYFTQAQRVARGVVTHATLPPTFAWAQALLIASIVSFAVLGIFALNHRRAIARESAF
jgi:methionine-rich copper-binding protein CopC